MLDSHNNKIEIKTTTKEDHLLFANNKVLALIEQENDMRNKNKINRDYKIFDYVFLFSYNTITTVYTLELIMNRNRDLCDQQYNLLGEY